MMILRTPLFLAALSLIPLTGCMVGPRYKTPAAATAPAFKEPPPPSFPSDSGWQEAKPGDASLKLDWWTMFGDTSLNELESQVDSANQTLEIAAANFRAARAQIGYARSNEAPTIGVGPSPGAVRYSANQPYVTRTSTSSGEGNFTLPVDLDYEIDLWGRIRRGVTGAREQAQASAAELENTRLSLHAELAMDYFGLRIADAQIRLLNDTVKAYEQALQLTQDRYDGGVSPQSDVAQARTQLEQARVQRTDLDVQRAQYEHAIAVLIGKPPAAFSLPLVDSGSRKAAVPSIPGTLPTTLLQRRPDIAGDERRMAAANEQIGIAQAAFYPTLSLSAEAGFQGTSLLNWFNWPSRLWAVGPTLSQTVFDAGRRRASKQITVAQYDAAVATYRQTVLTAFQQVEDNLAALRVLEKEGHEQHAATASAQQSLQLFQTRYEGGVDTYLQVVTWQSAALSNERNDLDVQRRRLDASVLLIKALGGGWQQSQLPAF